MSGVIDSLCNTPFKNTKHKKYLLSVQEGELNVHDLSRPYIAFKCIAHSRPEIPCEVK